MADCCQDNIHNGDDDPRYRRVLIVALILNAGMFVTEVVTSQLAGSVALLADALDFLGDSATYSISLFVLPLGLAVRAKAALFKAATMLVMGLGVSVSALWRVFHVTLPDAPVMGIVGFAALAVNVGVAALLVIHRNGDANRRSVWLCSRNDAIGNVAVIAAAGAVATTRAGWPDIVVALAMATLALSGAWTILRQARAELAQVSRTLAAE